MILGLLKRALQAVMKVNKEEEKEPVIILKIVLKDKVLEGKTAKYYNKHCQDRTHL